MQFTLKILLLSGNLLKPMCGLKAVSILTMLACSNSYTALFHHSEVSCLHPACVLALMHLLHLISLHVIDKINLILAKSSNNV